MNTPLLIRTNEAVPLFIFSFYLGSKFTRAFIKLRHASIFMAVFLTRLRGIRNVFINFATLAFLNLRGVGGLLYEAVKNGFVFLCIAFADWMMCTWNA